MHAWSFSVVVQSPEQVCIAWSRLPCNLCRRFSSLSAFSAPNLSPTLAKALTAGLIKGLTNQARIEKCYRQGFFFSNLWLADLKISAFFSTVAFFICLIWVLVRKSSSIRLICSAVWRAALRPMFWEKRFELYSFARQSAQSVDWKVCRRHLISI